MSRHSDGLVGKVCVTCSIVRVGLQFAIPKLVKVTRITINPFISTFIGIIMVSSIFSIIFLNLIYIIRFPTRHLMLQSKIIIQFFGLFFFQSQFLKDFKNWFQCSQFLACIRIAHKFFIKIMPHSTCCFIPLKVIIVGCTDDSQKDIVTKFLT